MNSLEAGPRSAALRLLSLLDEIASELECLVANGDTGWLKPLLVVHAEIYFTARRPSGVDAGAFADERRELGELLTRAPSRIDEFAQRFADARRASPRLRELHERALDVCRSPLERCDAA
jgi:hypothetical protein